MICKNCKRTIPQNSLYCNWCGKYQLPKKTKKISVPTPKRLPSGSWRIYLEREKKSITADTPDDCILQATEYRKQWEIDEAAGLHIPPPRVTTLHSVVEDYITSKEPVRSPSTIDGYNNILRNRFKNYMDLDVHAIDFQKMVNDELLKGVSAKTVRNAWGLVSSALSKEKIVFEPPSLPRLAKKERSWLTYEQINIFLAVIRESKYELPAILALHSLRKSELCGLRINDCDLTKQVIHIRGALVKTINGYVYTKLNKTDSSSRDVPILIPRLTELLDNIINNNSSSHQSASQYVVSLPRNNIYKEINKVCRQAGLPEVGIHGLRHSFASLAYHLGWKKMSTMAVGGWRNSKVLDEIYTHNADLQADVKTMQDFFVPDSMQD